MTGYNGYTRKNPKYYDGTGLTSHHIQEILPSVMTRIQAQQRDRPDMVISAWPSIIGDKFATMTQAKSFREGVLTVTVKDSTLLSLLSQHEKTRLLQKLRQNFPHLEIKSILFRIG